MSYRSLHLFFKFAEPLFYVSFGFNSLNKDNFLLKFSNGLLDRDNEFSVLFIESYSRNGIKQFLEVVLDSIRITTH